MNQTALSVRPDSRRAMRILGDVLLVYHEAARQNRLPRDVVHLMGGAPALEVLDERRLPERAALARCWDFEDERLVREGTLVQILARACTALEGGDEDFARDHAGHRKALAAMRVHDENEEQLLTAAMYALDLLARDLRGLPKELRATERWILRSLVRDHHRVAAGLESGRTNRVIRWWQSGALVLIASGYMARLVEDARSTSGPDYADVVMLGLIILCLACLAATDRNWSPVGDRGPR